MFYINNCIHYISKADRHGRHYLGCNHPKRYKLSSKLSVFLHRLFGMNYGCDCAPGYERYCPYYSENSIMDLVESIFKEEERTDYTEIS